MTLAQFHGIPISLKNYRGSGTRPIIFMTSDITNDWNGQSCTLKSILYTSPRIKISLMEISPPFLYERALRWEGAIKRKMNRAYDMVHIILWIDHKPTHIHPTQMKPTQYVMKRHDSYI